MKRTYAKKVFLSAIYHFWVIERSRNWVIDAPKTVNYVSTNEIISSKQKAEKQRFSAFCQENVPLYKICLVKNFSLLMSVLKRIIRFMILANGSLNLTLIYRNFLHLCILTAFVGYLNCVDSGRQVSDIELSILVKIRFFEGLSHQIAQY